VAHSGTAAPARVAMRFASCASSARASPGRRSCPPGVVIVPACRIDDQRLCELGRVAYVVCGVECRANCSRRSPGITSTLWLAPS
jgi:hypothetical protein